MKPDILVHSGGCQIDISRTAKLLIERHGRDAVLVAARWADCAAHSGNQERAAAWRQIVDTAFDLVTDLLRCAKRQHVLSVNLPPERHFASVFCRQVLDVHTEQLRIDGIHANLDQTVRISARRFEQSPYFGCYARSGMVLGAAFVVIRVWPEPSAFMT